MLTHCSVPLPHPSSENRRDKLLRQLPGARATFLDGIPSAGGKSRHPSRRTRPWCRPLSERPCRQSRTHSRSRWRKPPPTPSCRRCSLSKRTQINRYLPLAPLLHEKKSFIANPSASAIALSGQSTGWIGGRDIALAGPVGTCPRTWRSTHRAAARWAPHARGAGGTARREDAAGAGGEAASAETRSGTLIGFPRQVVRHD